MPPDLSFCSPVGPPSASALGALSTPGHTHLSFSHYYGVWCRISISGRAVGFSVCRIPNCFGRWRGIPSCVGGVYTRFMPVSRLNFWPMFVSIEYIYIRCKIVSSELVKVMVRKERKGRRAVDGHRINGRLSSIRKLWPVILDLGCDLHLCSDYMVQVQ